MPEEIKEKMITITAPNAPDIELLVSDIASTIAASARLNQDQIDEIKMAIIEACLNSFEHSRSSDNLVTVKFIPQEYGLKIIIKDHGVGFDPGKVSSPDLGKVIAKKIKKPRGWGLKIIRSLMDEVYINSDKSGTEVTLIKKRISEKNTNRIGKEVN